MAWLSVCAVIVDVRVCACVLRGAYACARCVMDDADCVACFDWVHVCGCAFM